MRLIEHIHGQYVHIRRVRVLSNHVAELIPQDAHVLDVGCGDGLLAHPITQRAPDLTLQGIDVQVREQTHIPVNAFDGWLIPYS